jgi:hypothetical protein
MFNFLSLFTSSTNTFREQLNNEQTVAVVRRHWVTLFWPMAFAALFCLIPFSLNSYLQTFSWYSQIESLYWFLTAVYFLVLWTAFFGNIMIYLLNALIITDQRVIDNQQKGLFQHEMNEMKLDKIQDITVKIQGFFPNILNYGDLQAQSAGSLNEFYFDTIPNPEKVKKTITSLQ